MMKRFFQILCMLLLPVIASAQMRYTNPVIHADYSDPDACEARGVYYMTASSFNCFPGLPVLKSTDLVHWDLVNYALTSYPGRNWKDGEPGNGRAKGKKSKVEKEQKGKGNAAAVQSEDDFHTKVQHGNGV